MTCVSCPAMCYGKSWSCQGFTGTTACTGLKKIKMQRCVKNQRAGNGGPVQKARGLQEVGGDVGINIGVRLAIWGGVFKGGVHRE